jgi:hypothetical protein
VRRSLWSVFLLIFFAGCSAGSTTPSDPNPSEIFCKQAAQYLAVNGAFQVPALTPESTLLYFALPPTSDAAYALVGGGANDQAAKLRVLVGAFDRTAAPAPVPLATIPNPVVLYAWSWTFLSDASGVTSLDFKNLPSFWVCGAPSNPIRAVELFKNKTFLGALPLANVQSATQELFTTVVSVPYTLNISTDSITAVVVGTTNATPNATPTPAPVASATPQATIVDAVLAPAFSSFALPALTGFLDAASNISYSATTGAGTQALRISASTQNWAGLPTIAGKTAIAFFTAGISTSGSVTFGAANGATSTFVGPGITAGTAYTVAYTRNGTALGSQVTGTATASSFPGVAGGELDVLTPFASLTLAPTDTIGIVVAR